MNQIVLGGPPAGKSCIDAERVFDAHVIDSVVWAIATAFAVHLEGRAVSLVVSRDTLTISDDTDARMVSVKHLAKALRVYRI